MLTERDVKLADGRILHVYDAASGDTDRLAVFWHHGTPNTGSPPEPLFPAADRLGIRWVSHDRPGYGTSTPNPGRSVASAATDVGGIADALGIERFAVMGHSGGSPHALACGALLPDRVLAVVGMVGLAPLDAEGLDWRRDMAPSGIATLQAAAEGRSAYEAYEASGAEYDPEFTPDDEAALGGEWTWVLTVVRAATASNTGGPTDDEVAFATPWGFDPADVACPVRLIYGGRDRVVPAAHGEWLARRCPDAELRLYPDDGHVSILHSAENALEWLHQTAMR